LGIIRIIRRNESRIRLFDIFTDHLITFGQEIRTAYGGYLVEADLLGVDVNNFPLNDNQMRKETLPPQARGVAADLMSFLADRLRVQVRAEGARYDVLAAVLGADLDDDLTRLLSRTDALAHLLGTEDGSNLLAGYRRAANILRIEEKKDGSHGGQVNSAWLEQTEEITLATALDSVTADAGMMLASENFQGAMAALASLRPYLDAFFEHVTVNDPRPDIRRNRLRLLARVRAAMHLAADFSKIEG
jgi:glycyl-tRNA synthetase beta chain